jgi:hypothetical protein
MHDDRSPEYDPAILLALLASIIGVLRWRSQGNLNLGDLFPLVTKKPKRIAATAGMVVTSLLPAECQDGRHFADRGGRESI